MARYLPRSAGEWEEHEDTKNTDRFVDGYGVLFEDFRASSHMSESQEDEGQSEAEAAAAEAAAGSRKSGSAAAGAAAAGLGRHQINRTTTWFGRHKIDRSTSDRDGGGAAAAAAGPLTKSVSRPVSDGTAGPVTESLSPVSRSVSDGTAGPVTESLSPVSRSVSRSQVMRTPSGGVVAEKLKNFASELRASGSTLARERDRRFRVFSSRAFSQKQMHGPSSPARKLGGMGGDGSKSCVRRQAGASTRPPLTST